MRVDDEKQKSIFCNGCFINPWHKTKKRIVFNLVKWFFSRKPDKWPKKIYFPKPSKITIPENQSIALILINHATFLIQTNTVNILTDPV